MAERKEECKREVHQGGDKVRNKELCEMQLLFL